MAKDNATLGWSWDLYARVPCHIISKLTELGWQRCYCIKRLAGPDPWHIYHQANVDRTKEKNLLKESLGSGLHYKEWHLIPVKVVKYLYASLPRRPKQFIQIKGNHMKY